MRSYYDLISHEGNRSLFTAIELSIASQVNRIPLHFHVEGLRGTGKTTIIRAARHILPPILRIKNCCYNCRPEAPHCPEHKDLSPEDIIRLGTELVPRPFLEISHSAKIGTVVGSIDLGKIVDSRHSVAALLPGTVPRAHRGIIFIDEINRLADTSPELVDVLLDIMGTKPGRVQIEETGLPTVELPVTASIWAASNPDEDPGPLQQIRKQLSDRFDLRVQMERPLQSQTVRRILMQPRQKDVLGVRSRELAVSDVKNVVFPNDILDVLAAIYIDFEIESIRAVEALELSATLLALRNGRKTVTLDDVADVVPLVFGHRLDPVTIERIQQYVKRLALQTGWEADTVDGLGNPAMVERNKKKNSWLKQLWQSACKKFSSGNGSPASSGATREQGEGQSLEGPTARPAATVTAAPPKQAIPLEQLPADKLVSVDSEP